MSKALKAKQQWKKELAEFWAKLRKQASDELEFYRSVVKEESK